MKLCTLLSVVILFTGCLDFGGQGREETSKEKQYFYQEHEGAERLFDVTTGALKVAQLKNIADHSFIMGNNYNHAKASLPSSIDDLIVDGNYAVRLGPNYTINSFTVADAFVELTGPTNIRSLLLGVNLFRFLIYPNKAIGTENTASVVLKGNGSFVMGEVSLRASFLTIEKAMLITRNWQESPPLSSGLIIDSARANDLWRMWRPSLSVTGSTVKAPSIALKKQSSLMLNKATFMTTKLDFEPESVVLSTSRSKVSGTIRARKASILMFEEQRDDQKNLIIGSLSSDRQAAIDGTISIYSAWSPDKEHEQEFFRMYQDSIEKKNRYLLVEGKQLLGRASLMSQSDTQTLLGNKEDMSYFEKFVSLAGKKLALLHDYNQGKLFLVIVDKNQKLDKDNCLPDVGAFDRKAYQELMK